jgi:hypothetical protein
VSRFVINPLNNPPTVVFRAGGGRQRLKITAITNGVAVWFSDDYNQLTNPRADGNPGGWPLVGGDPTHDKTDIWCDTDLYATTIGIPAEIEVAQLVHVKSNASYTPANPDLYTDPLTSAEYGGPVATYDQPETQLQSIGTQLENALENLFAPLRNLFGGG